MLKELKTYIHNMAERSVSGVRHSNINGILSLSSISPIPPLSKRDLNIPFANLNSEKSGENSEKTETKQEKPKYLDYNRNPNLIQNKISKELAEKNAIIENLRTAESYVAEMRKKLGRRAKSEGELSEIHQACSDDVIKDLLQRAVNPQTRSLCLKSIGQTLQKEFERIQDENKTLLREYHLECLLRKNETVKEFEEKMKEWENSGKLAQEVHSACVSLCKEALASFRDSIKDGPANILENIEIDLKKDLDKIMDTTMKKSKDVETVHDKHCQELVTSCANSYKEEMREKCSNQCLLDEVISTFHSECLKTADLKFHINYPHACLDLIAQHKEELRNSCEKLFSDFRKENRIRKLAHEAKINGILKATVEMYRSKMCESIEDEYIEPDKLERINRRSLQAACSYFEEQNINENAEQYVQKLEKSLHQAFLSIKDENEDRRSKLERSYFHLNKECVSIYKTYMAKKCEGTYISESELLKYHNVALNAAIDVFEGRGLPGPFCYCNYQKLLHDACEEKLLHFRNLNDINKANIEKDIKELIGILETAYKQELERALDGMYVEKCALLSIHESCLQSATSALCESKASSFIKTKLTELEWDNFSLCMFKEAEAKNSYFYDSACSKLEKWKWECVESYKRRMEEALNMGCLVEAELMSAHSDFKNVCFINSTDTEHSKLKQEWIADAEKAIDGLFQSYRAVNERKLSRFEKECKEIVDNYTVKYSAKLEDCTRNKAYGKKMTLQHALDMIKSVIMREAIADLEKLDCSFLANKYVSILDEELQKLLELQNSAVVKKQFMFRLVKKTTSISGILISFVGKAVSVGNREAGAFIMNVGTVLTSLAESKEK